MGNADHLQSPSSSPYVCARTPPSFPKGGLGSMLPPYCPCTQMLKSENLYKPIYSETAEYCALWIDESGMFSGMIMLTNTFSFGIVRDSVLGWMITHKLNYNTYLPVWGNIRWVSERHTQPTRQTGARVRSHRNRSGHHHRG